MTARLQDIVKSDQIALDIGVGMGDGIAHARLRRKIDDESGTIGPEHAVERLPVGNISADKLPLRL